MAIVNTHYGFCAKGGALNFTYTGNYNVRDDGVVELLTSGTLVFLDPAVIDIFCVGGGGRGGNPKSLGVGVFYGASGGAGGYTATARKQAVTGSYNITVGNGSTQSAVAGEMTSFGTLLSAAGGNSGHVGSVSSSTGNDVIAGKDGGSGSGGGVSNSSKYGAGGSDGGNGEQGFPDRATGGSGQGTTTREFGEATGKLYAGGGAGGRTIASNTPIVSMGGAGGGGTGGFIDISSSASGALKQAPAAGVANTGGGGGGGAGYRSSSSAYLYIQGANGGSGICCFRAAK